MNEYTLEDFKVNKGSALNYKLSKEGISKPVTEEKATTLEK